MVLHKLLDNLEIGILKISEANEITYANRLARHIFGIDTSTSADTVTRFHERFSDEKMRPLRKSWNPLTRTHHYQKPIKGLTLGFSHPKLKQQWYQFTVEPEFEEKNKYSGAVVFFQDVTLLHNQKITIETQKEALDKAIRFNSMGILAAGIAHEINNPLMIILGSTSIVQKELSKDSPDRQLIDESLEKTKEVVKRISSIVKNMQKLSRDVDDVELGAVDICKSCEDALAIFNDKIEKFQIKVEKKFSNAATINSNHTYVFQTFSNLISNAIDAIAPLPERWIKIEVTDSESSVDLTVTDSGHYTGDSESLFLPFYGTKDPGKGMGLGLSIVKQLLDKVNASIRFAEEFPNTTFQVKFFKARQ